jgi:uncharacterized protein
MTGKPLAFFVLVFALSVPFYLLGAAGGRLPGMESLPSSALMALVPMLAALILTVQKGGIDSVFASVKRELNVSKQGGFGWYLIAFLFMPLVGVLEFLALRLTGIAVPLPQIVPSEALFLFVVFFIAAIGEETGWQGYAYPALRSRLGALSAALLIGTVWALWHVIPFVQLGRSVAWIFWHSLSAIAMRIIIVWIAENTSNSIGTAVLFHTMINVSWALFPIAGSYYDPFVTFMILLTAAVLIVTVSGPKNFTRRKTNLGNQLSDRP